MTQRGGPFHRPSPSIGAGIEQSPVCDESPFVPAGLIGLALLLAALFLIANACYLAGQAVCGSLGAPLIP